MRRWGTQYYGESQHRAKVLQPWLGWGGNWNMRVTFAYLIYYWVSRPMCAKRTRMTQPVVRACSRPQPNGKFVLWLDSSLFTWLNRRGRLKTNARRKTELNNGDFQLSCVVFRCALALRWPSVFELCVKFKLIVLYRIIRWRHDSSYDAHGIAFNILAWPNDWLCRDIDADTLDKCIVQLRVFFYIAYRPARSRSLPLHCNNCSQNFSRHQSAYEHVNCERIGQTQFRVGPNSGRRYR